MSTTQAQPTLLTVILPKNKVNKHSVRYETDLASAPIGSVYIMNGAIGVGLTTLAMKHSKDTKNTNVFEPEGEQSPPLTSLYIKKGAWAKCPERISVTINATPEQVELNVTLKN